MGSTASAATAASQQQAAAAQQQAAAAGVLPIGSVVSTLPEGCPPETINGVEYHSCGGNTYRAAFQGSNLVYVTAQP